MRLREIQKNVLAQIFSAEDSWEPNSEILDSHQSSVAVSPLNIYRDSILGGLIHALRETYPVCQRLVGDYFFDAMAEQYCMCTPSHQPDLNEYGASFAEFIEEYQPAKNLQYLADMARLEWQCNLAFMASNEVRNNLDRLGQLSEQDVMSVVFYMPAGSSVMESRHPVEQIWKIHQVDEGDQLDAVELDASPVKLLIWRPRYEVSLVVLEDEQYTFLHHLQQQKTLAETCEWCLSHHPDMDINSMIEGIIQHGWVEGFYLRGP